MIDIKNLDKIKRRPNQKITKKGEIENRVGRPPKGNVNFKLTLPPSLKVRLISYFNTLADKEISPFICDLLDKGLKDKGF